MSEEVKKERLTVDLGPEEKSMLRVITAVHNEKHMQKMVIRLIRECYDRTCAGSISAVNPVAPQPNFHNEEMRNFKG